MLISVVTQALSVLTIGAQVLLSVGLIYFLFFQKAKESVTAKFISQRAIEIGFFVAFIATSGSLFFSEIAGYQPCELCWAQRIFMYPQVVLLGLAWIKKDDKIIDYSLAFSLIGALIAAYHNYIYYGAQVSAVCTSAVSCLAVYFTEFGFVTIPLMSLTAFLSLIFLFGMKKASKN